MLELQVDSLAPEVPPSLRLSGAIHFLCHRYGHAVTLAVDAESYRQTSRVESSRTVPLPLPVRGMVYGADTRRTPFVLEPINLLTAHQWGCQGKTLSHPSLYRGCLPTIQVLSSVNLSVLLLRPHSSPFISRLLLVRHTIQCAVSGCQNRDILSIRSLVPQCVFHHGKTTDVACGVDDAVVVPVASGHCCAQTG